MSKRLSSPAFVIALLLFAFNAHSENLRDSWLDRDTGHRVIRISRISGESESFYFHQNAFTAAGDKMVFANTDQSAPVPGRNSGRPPVGPANYARDFFVYDWRSQKIDRLTDGGTNRGEIVAPKSRQLFYMRENIIYATHLDTRATKQIAQLPRGWRGLTINADETLLAGAFGQGAAEISRGQPRSYWFKAVQEAKLPHILFTLEIATGKTNIIHTGNDWFNHVQFSPSDSSLLMFCHEGPWHLVNRIWNIRTDGSSLRLIHQRTVTNEIAGHEFWSPDGKSIWFDLQIPRGEKFFLAGVTADVTLAPRAPSQGTRPTPNEQHETNKQPLLSLSPSDGEKDQGRGVPLSGDSANNEIRYPVERDQWSVHFNISHDGKLFAGDGGAQNMVAHAKNGKWLWLFIPQPNGTLKAEQLVNMSSHDYSLEPNVNFTPDGKWLVFRGNFEGTPQVYAVEVAKNSKSK